MTWNQGRAKGIPQSLTGAMASKTRSKEKTYRSAPRYQTFASDHNSKLNNHLYLPYPLLIFL